MRADPIQMRLELLESFEQEVADVRAARPAPHTLDQIQIRAVGWEPRDFEAGPDLLLFEESLNSLGLVDAGIVGDENDSSAGSLRPVPQILDEHQEAPRDFPWQPDEFRVPVGVLHRSKDEFLAVLARSRNGELMSPPPPPPREMGMEMTFGLVLVPEFEVGAGLDGFFFRRESRFLALRCASSSRFPLSVCLGRP